MSDIYSPPDSELEQQAKGGLALASRWSRLFAAMIDGIISMLFTVPVMMVFGVWDSVMKGESPSVLTNIALGVASLIFYVLVHGYLLHKNGQTIGKKLLGIRIVSINHETLSLVEIIAKRHFPIAAISLIPIIGPYLVSIEALFVFRKDKRCIHDLIAGTKVVSA